MQHIETVTVGSGGAASITFSAIPDTFTDLYLTLSARSVTTAADVNVIYNTTGGTYSNRRLFGTGSAASSDSASLANVLRASTSSETANTFSNGALYLPNYRSSSAKSYSTDTVQENNATGSIQMIVAGLWSGTDPITSITLAINTGANFAQYTSASLYGILAGSDGIVAVS